MKRSWLILATALAGTIAQAQTVMDIDGNVYSTVVIGNQVWMAENLLTTHFQDGALIPHVINNSTWTNLIQSPGMCYPNNDSINTASAYHALYNFWAVTNPGNLCPTGWHVPTDSEWNTMAYFLDNTVDTNFVGATGTGTDIGNQLKESGSAHWDLGNGGTNSSGFTARGAGYRRSNGTFSQLLTFAHFWTSSFAPQSKGWTRTIGFNDPTINRFVNDRLVGLSVRCMSNDLITSIDQKHWNDGLDIYPNPTSGWLIVKLREGKNIDLILFNTLGEPMLAETLSFGVTMIDMQALPNGVYTARFTIGDRQFHKQVIKN